MDRDRLVQLRDFHRRQLLDDVVPFWTKHSIDREAGGFLFCLDRDGSVYSTDKPVWITGRATWLYATLYQSVEPRPEWLELARHGYDFLVKHCFDEHGKMYFSVARDGRPLRMRRYVFSEVFGVMAFAALARATGDEQYRRRAIDLFDSLARYLTTPGLIPPKVDPHTRPLKGLSPRMCLLSVAEMMLEIDADQRYERIISDVVGEIFRDFVKSDEGIVLETVAPDGGRIDAPEGRCMSPGHSIETAWFLMSTARRRGDRSLVERSARILEWAVERGWDAEHGGLLYFIDVAGKPSPYLEHEMKLWWVHSEALYGALLAYHLTGNEKYAVIYERLHEWTFAHFPDRQWGEWFGYLRRDGTPSSLLKGNLWKGPFHIPRALLFCWKLLEEMTGATKR